MKHLSCAAFALIALACHALTGCAGPEEESHPEVASAEEALNGSVQTPAYRMPAEWEPHDSLWLAWPTYDSMQGRPKEPLYFEMIEALAPYVDVNLLVATEAEVTYVRDLLDAHQVPRHHVTFRVIPSVIDIWVRDTGPTFVKNAAGDLSVVDFEFNSWGYEGYTSLYPWDADVLDRDVARQLHLPVLRSSMISEGGAVELNGQGTMIMAESVAFQRNPGMSRAQIEAEYRSKLGVEKVIWVPEGVPEDDLSFWRNRGLPSDVYTVLTVGGHTDEFVRFIDEDTVLLAQVTACEAAQDPVAAEARDRLEVIDDILSGETTHDGKPLEVIRVPAATPIYETMGPGDETYTYLTSLTFEDGSTIPPNSPITTISAASYMNYVVTNGVVLVPKYWKPGRPFSVLLKDTLMALTLSAVFPGRQIVQINPEAINVGGGGMHCAVQQQPAAPAPN